MNKKLMAVAVAGALAVPAATAMAQTSTVQIGGSLTALWYIHKPNNPSIAKKGDMLHMSEPELFIQGEEKLGGGLSAWFRCASEIDIMSAEAFGLCHRNSGIGFKGAFGNFFLANWDTPHKLVTNKIRGAFSGTNALYGGGSRLLHNGSGSGVANPPGVTSEGLNATSFYRRQANSVNYHSPSWGGFVVQGAVSSANETTGLPVASPLKPRLYSVAAHYDNGPLYVGAAWERHQDYNPGNLGSYNPDLTVNANAAAAAAAGYVGGDDDSWQVGAGFTLAGNLKLTGMYTRNKYERTSTTELKTDGAAVYVDWKVAGPHTVRAAYAKLRHTKGNAAGNVGTYVGPGRGLACGPTSTASCATNTGADWFSVHYEYAFSKRTAGLVSYNRISNDDNARFGLGKTTVTTGGDQTAMGVALKHRF